MSGQEIHPGGVAVTARGKRAITLEGNADSVTAMIGRIRDDGQLVPVASRTVDLPGGLVRVDVDLTAATPVRPERAAPRRPFVSLEFCLRAGLAILGSGILITAAWGVAAMLTWLWSQILLYGPALVTLALIAVLAWWAMRPAPWLKPVRQARREQARRSLWNWLSDDDRKPKAQIAQPAFDPHTDRWLCNLRNPAHRQTTTAHFGSKRARCALGWGFDPRHTLARNYRDARSRYGRRMVREVESMNQAGVPLPKVADHIERELSKRGRR